MKKIYVFLLFCCLAGTTMAQHYCVTYMLDMSNEASIVADSILLPGDYQAADLRNPQANWTLDGHIMQDPDGDLIYEIELLLPAGTYEFSGINGFDWNNQEDQGMDTTCAIVNGFGQFNRIMTITSDTLIGYVFNSCTPIAVAEKQVTFNVDMSNEATISDTILVVGNFQAVDVINPQADWTLNTHYLTDPDGDLIYTGSVRIPVGAYEFAFINGSTWAGREGDAGTNLDSTCAAIIAFGQYTRLATITRHTCFSFIFNSCSPSTNTEDLPAMTADLQLAPNPMTDNGRIQISNPDNEELNLFVTSLTGQIVKVVQNIRSNVVELDRNDLETGVYFVTLMNTQGVKITKKLVVL